jgi:anti-sigma regulatory factor (Ser/Thr protein kinase)
MEADNPEYVPAEEPPPDPPTEASAAYPHPAICIEVKLDPDPASVRAARVFVATNLRELGLPENADNGAIVVSELASNAVKHASGAPFWVVLRIDAEQKLTIEVHDSCPNRPELLPADFLSEGGRGLHVVDALCESWMCVPSGSGKAVIATLHGRRKNRSAANFPGTDPR